MSKPVVAQAVASSSPHRFVSLTSLSIPPVRRLLPLALNLSSSTLPLLLKQVHNSWYMIFFQLPRLPEYWLTNFRGLEFLWRSWSEYSSPEYMSHLNLVKNLTFSQPGVLQSTLAYYRHIVPSLIASAFGLTKYEPCDPLAWIYSVRDKNAKIRIPTLFAVGEQDACLSRDIFTLTIRDEDYLNVVEMKVISEAGHFLQLEQPQAINAMLMNWIQRHS